MPRPGSASITVVVQNPGAAAISALTSTISGPNMADYTILPSSTCGATLAGASSCNIDIEFSPSTAGARSAFLEVTYTAPSTPSGAVTAALNGIGL